MAAWDVSPEKAQTPWNVRGDVFTSVATVQTDDEWKEKWRKMAKTPPATQAPLDFLST